MADAAKKAMALAQQIIDSGSLTPRVPFVDLAACVLFVWDYFLTFDLEVQHIWKAKWNLIKVIYLLQRYLPFVDSCYLGMYRQLAYHIPQSQCRWLPIASGMMSVVGISLSEILLGLRVYAVWSRNKLVAAFLLVIGVAFTAGMLVGMYRYAGSLKYLDLSTLGLIRPGCFVTSAGNPHVFALLWVALLVWNTITMILMLIPGYTVYRSGVRSELWTVLYKDGAYFYVYLCLLSVMNIVFVTSMRPALRVAVTVLERTLHSTLASRLTLHMRDQASGRGTRGGLFSGGASDIEMNTAPVLFAPRRTCDAKTSFLSSSITQVKEASRETKTLVD